MKNKVSTNEKHREQSGREINAISMNITKYFPLTQQRENDDDTRILKIYESHTHNLDHRNGKTVATILRKNE